jgi:hypothetical protein
MKLYHVDLTLYKNFNVKFDHMATMYCGKNNKYMNTKICQGYYGGHLYHNNKEWK